MYSDIILQTFDSVQAQQSATTMQTEQPVLISKTQTQPNAKNRLSKTPKHSLAMKQSLHSCRSQYGKQQHRSSIMKVGIVG